MAADLSSICVGVERLGPFDDDIAYRCENPMRWHETLGMGKEKPTKDVLFDNEDMRAITLAQCDGEKPEYIKWKLLGYNLVITYEYILKEKFDQALETIHNIENILSSIGKDDYFLKSIKVALNHITYSMKSYVLKSCDREIVLERFVMPDNMNKVNKAAIFGIKALFLYEYGITFAHISKDCALKAISLNGDEAEWYFLLARILTNWQRTCTNLSECSNEEIDAAQLAVELGNKNHHKIHLALVYQRWSRNMKNNIESKNNMLNAAFKLLIEVKNDTNDLLLLKNCFLSLAKIALERPNMGQKCIQEILDELLVKLKSSNNGYVHGAIGNYYLFNKKDYKTANYHLQKAFEAKSFGSSIDYIYTFYNMDPDLAPVEEMLVGMLKTFPHAVHQEKILSQIVSYLIMTKQNLIQAIKYVPMLLNIKNVSCLYSLQTHRVKFTQQRLTFNLLEVLSEKLDAAMKDPTFPEENKKRVIEVTQLLEQFENYVSIFKTNTEHSTVRNYKMDYCNKIDKPFSNSSHKDWRTLKHLKQDTKKQDVKKNDEENWRTLKPDSNSAAQIFTRYNKQTSSSGMEIKSRFNFKN